MEITKSEINKTIEAFIYALIIMDNVEPHLSDEVRNRIRERLRFFGFYENFIDK
tara:strand:+ start:373 stop:534 length:162 start_codon:yes stop_codon:yes gene_type:complete